VAEGTGAPGHHWIGLGGDEHNQVQCHDQRLREGRQVAKALALRSSLGQASGETRTIGYIAAISACENGGEWQRGLARCLR
jgi:hypothetical protein